MVTAGGGNSLWSMWVNWFVVMTKLFAWTTSNWVGHDWAYWGLAELNSWGMWHSDPIGCIWNQFLSWSSNDVGVFTRFVLHVWYSKWSYSIYSCLFNSGRSNHASIEHDGMLAYYTTLFVVYSVSLSPSFIHLIMLVNQCCTKISVEVSHGWRYGVYWYKQTGRPERPAIYTHQC